MTQFSCLFNEYEIQQFGQELKILKIADNMTKYKMQAIKDRQWNVIYSSFLVNFNEPIYLGPNQSFRVLIDVWKHDWTLTVLGQ